MKQSKALIYMFLMWMAFLSIGCSKSDSGGTTTPTPRDTTPIIITPPPVPTYVVKTIGISRMRVALDDVTNNLVIAEFVGGGNRVIVKAGSGNMMEFSNPHGYEPAVLTAGGGTPDAVYPVVNAAINNANTLDTNMITLKLKGFDKTKTGYDQLNIVLCKETGIGASASDYYNLTMLRYNIGIRNFNNAYYQKALTTAVNISALVIAPAVSASSYIVRDAVMTSGAVVSNTVDSVIRFDAGTSFWTSAKFNLNQSGAISVGGPIKIELVNSEKGTARLNGSPDGENAFIFSNIKKGVVGTVTIPEPADTVGNVFIRLSGFNAGITGYDQLTLILADDGVIGGGQIGMLQANPVPRKLTLPLLQKSFSISNFSCIQLYTK